MVIIKNVLLFLDKKFKLYFDIVYFNSFDLCFVLCDSE